MEVYGVLLKELALRSPNYMTVITRGKKTDINTVRFLTQTARFVCTYIYDSLNNV